METPHRKPETLSLMPTMATPMEGQTMSRNSISGVVLDEDYEYLTTCKLPKIDSIKTSTYKGKEFETRQTSYGEMMLLGDFHIGHESHATNPFNAHLNFLNERKHIQIGLMGDYIEYAVNTPYIESEVINVDQQIDLFVRAMKPLAKRINFILWGNHEERYALYTKSNRLMKGIAREIGVTNKCFIGEPQRGVNVIISAGRRKYGMYAHHSKTGAIINKTIQLRRSGSQIRAALIAHGHTHHLGYEQRTIRELTNNRRITKRQWLVSTGCFMKDASYAEARSYPLNVVGAPLIRFYADHGKIDFVDISTDYRDYLTKGGIAFPGAEVGVQDWGDIKKRPDSWPKFDYGATRKS